MNIPYNQMLQIAEYILCLAGISAFVAIEVLLLSKIFGQPLEQGITLKHWDGIVQCLVLKIENCFPLNCLVLNMQYFFVLYAFKDAKIDTYFYKYQII